MSEENAISKLLSYDRTDLEKPTKKHRMALSKLGGVFFDFEIQGLTAQQACSVQDATMEYDSATGACTMHSFRPLAITLMGGCPTVFRNNELRKHYDCATFDDLIELMLTKNEADELAEAIRELSEFEIEDLDISDSDLKN